MWISTRCTTSTATCGGKRSGRPWTCSSSRGRSSTSAARTSPAGTSPRPRRPPRGFLGLVSRARERLNGLTKRMVELEGDPGGPTAPTAWPSCPTDPLAAGLLGGQADQRMMRGRRAFLPWLGCHRSVPDLLPGARPFRPPPSPWPGSRASRGSLVRSSARAPWPSSKPASPPSISGSPTTPGSGWTPSSPAPAARLRKPTRGEPRSRAGRPPGPGVMLGAAAARHTGARPGVGLLWRRRRRPAVLRPPPR